MNLNKVLTGLKNLLIVTRRTGQTTILNKIAKKYDVWILIHNHEHKQNFNKTNQEKIFSISEIDKLRGKKERPIIIDNALLFQLIDNSLSTIDNQRYVISEYEESILKIEDSLRELKSRNVRQIPPTPKRCVI